MKFAQGVSFPRSGHGLLVQALATYYSRGKSLNAEPGWIDAAPFRYCEYYHHCRKVPCARKEATFSKNHDFDLGLPVNADWRYLVQWRHPLPAIISLYRLDLANGNLREDSLQSWARYYPVKLDYWRRFYRKWVRPKWPNAYVLRYEELTVRPHEKLHDVLRFLEPSRHVEEELLAQVVLALGVFSQDKVSTFSHLTEVQIEEFEEAFHSETSHA